MFTTHAAFSDADCILQPPATHQLVRHPLRVCAKSSQQMAGTTQSTPAQHGWQHAVLISSNVQRSAALTASFSRLQRTSFCATCASAPSAASTPCQLLPHHPKSYSYPKQHNHAPAFAQPLACRRPVLPARAGAGWAAARTGPAAAAAAPAPGHRAGRAAARYIRV